MSGEELSIPSSENGFVLLRTGDMFFGTGFIEDGRVKLLIPASRQIGDRV
jgi:hypothetical protein